MRGREKVDVEFALMAIANNLRKWAKNITVNNPFADKTIWEAVNTYTIPKICSESKNAA